MKEKKTWKKRVLSIVLAFAMVLTQFGVWNAGKESVQAAEQNEANVSEITKDGYTLKLSADKKEVTVGDTITFQVSLEKDGKKITNLQEEGYHIYWWNITMNSESEFVNYDSKAGGYAMTMGMVPQKAGENEIKINLQDSGWNKIIEELKIKVNVKESDSVVKDAAIDVTKTDKELSSDFIMGMDISSMISELESGVVYRDYEGNELKTLDDICKFLANQGINHIRIRVWNNPYDTKGKGYGGGNNDVAKAKQFADACRNAGIKMLVDFHCSDLWTDPGKQYVPKAWKGYTVEQKAEALTAFLEASLNTIDPTKDVVDMVQVGNETTSGFIGETDVANMCTLFEAGSKGVKAYNNEVKVVIHLTNPEKANMTRWAKRLDENKVDYDILATSYYPYWHGTLDNLKTQLETVKNTYGKDVMVAETSYAYTLEDSDGHSNTVRVGNNDTADNATEPFTEQGQATAIRNLINTVNNAGGLGVYYWEPAWLTVGDTTGLTGEAYDKQVAANKEKWEKYGSGWASSYASEFDAKDAGVWFGGSAVDNEAMFYPDGTASPSLHVWNYVKTGAVSNEVSVEGMGADLTQEVLANSTFELPKTLDVMYSDETKAEEITWNETDVKKIDTTKAGTYQVAGTVTFSKEITRGTYKGKKSAEVTLTLKVKQANLITNEAAVEFDDGSVFTIDGTMFKNIPSTENPKSGKHSMSWYSAAEATGSVTYNEAITLAKGSYTFEAYAEGKDASVIMQVLNAENDSVLSSGDATEVTGWNEWKTPKVTFTLDKETSVKFRIAVENKAAGWGSVDVLYLHQEGASGDNNGSDSGSSSNTTVVTPTDKDTTEIKNVTAATPSGEKVEATVTITKDSNGNVTDAGATVKNTKPEISADVAAKIVQAAGTDNVAITTEVTDAKGNTKYTVTVDAKNLTAGNTLKVLAVDKKTGEKKLVNAKSYKVDENGTISVSLPKGCEYQLVTTKEVEKVEKAVLKTVEVKKTSASVKKGKSTKIQLSSKLDMENVKSVTYTTTKKSVVKVAKNGKITAKKKGTAVVKATVTLKSGKKKTVTMKVKVK